MKQTIITALISPSKILRWFVFSWVMLLGNLYMCNFYIDAWHNDAGDWPLIATILHFLGGILSGLSIRNIFIIKQLQADIAVHAAQIDAINKIWQRHD
jgi:hypothetical protein